MKIIFIAIGTELLRGWIEESNIRSAIKDIAEWGDYTGGMAWIEDDTQAIAKEIERFHREAVGNVLILSGGLGQTKDDRTKQAMAMVFGDRVAVPLPNPVGKESGWLYAVEKDKGLRQGRLTSGNTDLPQSLDIDRFRYYIFLPGVPDEFQAIWKQTVLPLLKNSLAKKWNKKYIFWGFREREVDSKLASLSRYTILARPYRVEVYLTASSQRELERQEEEIRRSFSHEVMRYSDCEDLTDRLHRLLVGGGHTLAVAESCTGGWIAKKITDRPGSSQYFKGGIIAYSNAVKNKMLGVSEQILRRDGAVSRPCAEAMVQGVIEAMGSDYGAATTGIAGPGGGSAEKPVGLVYIGWGRRLSDGEIEVKVEKILYPHSRQMIREFAGLRVLHGLCQWIEDERR